MTTKQFIRLYSLAENHKKYRVRIKNKNRIKRGHNRWWKRTYEIAKWNYDSL